ncbi:unnamed protein product, partial [Prorocentrum cordatum]
VCISYLTEDGLLQCASMRRWDLHETKHFWCTCERCGGEKDFSRGFRCPKCEEGAIFSRTPAPGAASSAALQPEELVNESCSSCKFKVTKKEAERLTKLERTLRVSIDKYAEQKRADEAVALKSFRATEEIIDASFFQHALADLMWEKLADYYAQHQRSSDHRRLLERRCAFHEAAYPGLSAAHAWCLEAGACCRGALRHTSTAGCHGRGRQRLLGKGGPPEVAEGREGGARGGREVVHSGSRHTQADVRGEPRVCHRPREQTQAPECLRASLGRLASSGGARAKPVRGWEVDARSSRFGMLYART